MFIDYYTLLDISENATSEEIKQAFKKQAIKWHPDRNPTVDTAVQMQRINEAYLILKDSEARGKFDAEYQLFKIKRRKYQADIRQEADFSYKKHEYTKYHVNDDLLETWIANARKQAVALAQETIKDFREMATVGMKEGAKASGNALLSYVILGVIASTIVALVKACN